MNNKLLISLSFLSFLMGACGKTGSARELIKKELLNTGVPVLSPPIKMKSLLGLNVGPRANQYSFSSLCSFMSWTEIREAMSAKMGWCRDVQILDAKLAGKNIELVVRSFKDSPETMTAVFPFGESKEFNTALLSGVSALYGGGNTPSRLLVVNYGDSILVLGQTWFLGGITEKLSPPPSPK